MKIIFHFVFLSFISFLSYAQSSSTEKEREKRQIVFILPIKEEIGPASSRHIEEGFKKAKELKADFIILHLNTYGGTVDDADKMRTILLNSKIPVFAFIDNNAASAGALISIACDSIYMSPGASIGAATVVGVDGTPAPEKYQSYMRSMLRSTAEAKGRDPKIAEAMNDIHSFIPGIKDSGQVLTFTTSEAIKNNFCEGEARSVEEVLQLAGIENYEIEEYKVSALGKVIDFLINPFVSGILIMIIIGGIYYELQTPGVGFPLAAAVIAALLYFAPHYLEGLAAHWEILLFIAGIILLLVEIFVIPGFGVTGVAGILLMVMGLTLSLVQSVPTDFPVDLPDGNDFVKALFIVVVSVLLSLGISFLFAGRFVRTGLFRRVSVQAEIGSKSGYVGVNERKFELVGKRGTAFTVLRPSGKVQIEGDVYDATAETGFIEKGECVIVVKYEAAQLFVRKAE